MGAANVGVLVLLLGVFYLLLVRPQKRRMRQHQDLVTSLIPGDEVVTIGGIIGYVKQVGEESISLEIADGCVIRVARQAIGRKVEADSADLDAPGETADLEPAAPSDELDATEIAGDPEPSDTEATTPRTAGGDAPGEADGRDPHDSE
jgi:preprotein translocase subunit YajC